MQYAYNSALTDAQGILPREAIEAAIVAMQTVEFLPHSEAVNDTYIEQLQALLQRSEG